MARTTNGTAKPTRGGQLLAGADSQSAIAERMGVSKSLAGMWIVGQRKPTAPQRARLEEIYEIPAGVWDEPPAPNVAPPPPPPPDDDDDDDDGGGVEENNNERLRRYIRQGMRDLRLDTQLSGVKRAEALKKLVDAQVALDRSTGENALTMNKIVAHPEFQRIWRIVVEANAAFPDALRAVTKALEDAQR